MSVLGYVMIFGVMAALSALTVYGLWWGLREGQFFDPRRGAESIFDAGEPIGMGTDGFPPGLAGARAGTDGRGEVARVAAADEHGHASVAMAPECLACGRGQAGVAAGRAAHGGVNRG